MSTTLNSKPSHIPLSDAQTEWLRRHLRRVLAALYDPGILHTSPLLDLFDIRNEAGGGAALRRAITDSIESLRPRSSTPITSRSWRMYHILRRRYTEQITQQEVASDLGLSVRQLQREEKTAREVLLDFLLNRFDVSPRIENYVAAEPSDQTSGDLPATASTTTETIPTLDDELAQLQEAVPARPVNVRDMVEEVLHILTPLINSSQLTVDKDYAQDLPSVVLRPPMLRQALLNIISTAVRCSHHHHLVIRMRKNRQYIVTEITAQSNLACEYEAPANSHDSLAMAEQLVHLCKGTLEISRLPEVEPDKSVQPNEHLMYLKLMLPAAEQVAVLFIDDNQDVLQLYQRYLTRTAYRYIGAQSTQQGLELALSAQPEMIVLDVMMPGQDGWTLLGLLREHPQTSHIPVIVCSILTQEDLALALGAVDYVKKPITRQDLLAVLNRQTEQVNPASG